MAKMQAKKPDVIAFNGYANQYKDAPIAVRKGEKVRMYVLNAGPSIWSAFHVIGTVFDRTVIEGTVGHDVADDQPRARARAAGSSSRSPRRAPTRSSPTRSATWSRARWACSPPRTRRRPPAHDERRAGRAHDGAPPPTADVNVTLGDMWVKADKPTAKAGKVSFAVKNEGATMHGMAIGA